MLAPLLILLTVSLFSPSHCNFADDIVKKQEECNEILNRVGSNVLDEGGDTFPGIPSQYYDKCKDDLDNLKHEFLDKFYPGVSFPYKLFPAKLSNKILIMLQIPSETESYNVSDILCLSCEVLCSFHDRCKAMLEDIDEISDNSVKNYYKLEYEQCAKLLDEQKTKFFRKHKISEELLAGVHSISLVCKNETFLLPLQPLVKSEKRYFENDIVQNKGNEVMSGQGIDSNQDFTENKNIEKYAELNIQSTGKITEHTLTENDKDNSKITKTEFEINDGENNAQVNGLNNGVDTLNFNGDAGSTKENKYTLNGKGKEHITIIGSSAHIYSSSRRFSNKISADDTESDKDTKKAEFEATGYDHESTINPESTNHEKTQFGEYDHGVIITATPMPETLGDEIFEKESECENILSMANKVLDYRLFESVRYYDDQYTECKHSLDKVKKHYAERHGINLKNYKSVFPVVHSSGVERLVALPMTICKDSHTAILPGWPSSTSGGSSETHLKLTIEDTYGGYPNDDGKDFHGDQQIINRMPMENPAFISNEEFNEYFNKNSPGDTESTLVRFAKMIRKSSGRSERTSD